MTRRRKNYTVRCVREDGWWLVSVDELDGVFTHARRIGQIEPLARDAIALWLDIEPDGFDLHLEVDVPPKARAALDEALEARSELESAKGHVASATLTAVTALTKVGLPMRDIGELVGVSHQRVGQILEATKK